MITLENFPEELMSYRDELAYRKLLGEQLSDEESILLDALNRLVELILPKPDMLDEVTLTAMSEVKSMLKK